MLIVIDVMLYLIQTRKCNTLYQILLEHSNDIILHPRNSLYLYGYTLFVYTICITYVS